MLTKAAKDWKQTGNLIRVYWKKKNYKEVKEIGNNQVKIHKGRPMKIHQLAHLGLHPTMVEANKANKIP